MTHENQKKERSASLTCIGWWLILSQTHVISGLLWMLSTIDLDYAGTVATWSSSRSLFAVANAILRILCGYGILRGLPWSRLLYAAGSLAMLMIYQLVSEMRPDQTARASFVSLLVYLIFLVLLFRPRADEWFGAKALQLRQSAG